MIALIVALDKHLSIAKVIAIHSKWHMNVWPGPNLMGIHLKLDEAFHFSQNCYHGGTTDKSN